MPMVSLKTSEDISECCRPSPYGWGTQLNLNEDQCEALGIKEPLRAGQKVLIQAIAYVQSSTERAEEGGEETDVCMCLQVTDMELGAVPTATKSAAEVLYKKGD